jgi:hypothetical protein
MELAFVELLEAFDFAIAFDSTSFCRRDSSYGISHERKRGSVSESSLGSYGSDYFSLQDKDRDASECFSVSDITADYRVPTGYFGHDAMHKNRRGSDLTMFMKYRNKPRMRATKSEGDLCVAQQPIQLHDGKEQETDKWRVMTVRPKSNFVGRFFLRRAGASP